MTQVPEFFGSASSSSRVSLCSGSAFLPSKSGSERDPQFRLARSAPVSVEGVVLNCLNQDARPPRHRRARDGEEQSLKGRRDKSGKILSKEEKKANPREKQARRNRTKIRRGKCQQEKRFSSAKPRPSLGVRTCSCYPATRLLLVERYVPLVHEAELIMGKFN